MARNSNAAASGSILANYGKEIETHKDGIAEAANLGNTLTAGGVTQRMMALAFRLGVISHEKNMGAYDFKDAFDAYAANWYGKDKGLGRQPLDAKSRKTLIKGYQHFTQCALRYGDKGRPLVTAIMEMTNTPVSTRGSKIGELMAKPEWKTKAPDAKAITAATKAKSKPRGKGKGKAAYNGKGALRGLCSNAESYAAKPKAEFIGWLRDKPTYGVLVREYLEAAAALRKALAEADGTSEKNRKEWNKLVANTLAVANRLPRSAGKRANAN